MNGYKMVHDTKRRRKKSIKKQIKTRKTRKNQKEPRKTRTIKQDQNKQ